MESEYEDLLQKMLELVAFLNLKMKKKDKPSVVIGYDYADLSLFGETAIKDFI